MTRPVTHNAVVIALFGIVLGGCGSETTKGEGGTGGILGMGGTATGGAMPGSGGTSSSGGIAGAGWSGSGGSPGTGGVPGTGGILATGGTSGPGGTTSTGGTSGPGGTTGSGGVTSSGGGTSTGGMSTTGGATNTGGARVTGGQSGTDAGGTSGSAGQGGGRATTPTCTTGLALSIGDNHATLQHDGRSRSYIAYVPRSIESDIAVPLVLDFHGSGDTSARQESWSGWREKADQEGFIVVYPDGVGNTWNVGNCCGQALSENVDDVDFTRALIEAVSTAACIDAKRVYATGMSNGAGFVHRLACEAADVIAAIAAASADLVTDPCTPARPISELSVRGLDDTMVAYEGGNTGSTGWYSPGAVETLELWKEIDQCTGSVHTSSEYCQTYSSCGAGVEVSLCSLPNTGHGLYQNPVGFDVPEIAWEMFQRQPMP